MTKNYVESHTETMEENYKENNNYLTQLREGLQMDNVCHQGQPRSVKVGHTVAVYQQTPGP